MAQAKLSSKFSSLLRGEILRRWELLTIADLDELGCDRLKLINIVQTRYGYAPSRAEKEVELFFDDFQDRLRMAA